MEDAANIKKTLIETLRTFDTLMVGTEASNGTVHARPMVLAEVDDAGEIWFVTPKESDKVDEVSVESRAVVTGQSERAYISVSGQIDVIHDPQRVATLWKAEWNAWFPQTNGADDAHAVVLMRLRPEIGEYWLQGGLKGIRYLFEATRAMLDGTVPRDDQLISHAKVPM
jgi:general stress protein 26